MTLSQDARYKAYRSALAHLQTNETIIAGVAALPPLVKAAGEMLDAIVAADQRKIQNDTGHAAQKKIQHDELSSLSFTVAQAIAAYADAKKDEPLRVAARMPRSELFRSRGQVLAEKSANLLAKAKELGKELDAYGITDATLVQLAALLEQYVVNIRAPRTASAMRQEAGMRLEDLLAQVKQLLTRQVDPLVVQLKATNPEFYNQYALLRAITGAARRKTRVEGLILLKASRTEMANATVQIKGTELVTTTGPDGRFSLYTPNMKVVSVIIQKEGYKPVEVEAQVRRGQATFVEVEMEAV